MSSIPTNFLQEMQALIEDRLSRVLIAFQGPINSVESYSWGGISDVRVLLELFKVKCPCLLLSRPSIQYNSRNNVTSGYQTCRIDPVLTYRLACVTSNEKQSENRNAEWQNYLTRLLWQEIAGRQFLDHEMPNGTKCNYIDFVSTDPPFNTDEVNVVLHTFRVACYGSGGPY